MKRRQENKLTFSSAVTSLFNTLQ